MDDREKFTIRPAGRHILTIGRDLIQNQYAAIIELIKNAYDADSPDVNIEFKIGADGNCCSISIEDHGHGMSRETVINKWMVPSTDDKLRRRKSPRGRTMQGQKGVGRYAASILGNDLLLETVTPEGEMTTVYLEWAKFESAEYLDDVEILIETKTVTQPSGTRLTISGNNEIFSEWNEDRLNNLKSELKKLISPVSVTLPESVVVDEFKINLTRNRTDGQRKTITEVIEPFPIFDLYDYRIAGEVSAKGKAWLTYSVQKARNTPTENIEFDLGSPTGCGDLVFDIRVYDREKEAIDLLIRRGLKDDAGIYLGNLQARQLLNVSNGIGVYRNGFRLRPLGDPDFDWLKLNEQRVQNPSLRIGSNQVIGYVQIQSEEQSNLIEKSARDGLRENTAFEKLKKITTEIIGKLEERRFEYRKKAGLSRSALKVERELEKIFSFDELKKGIRERLTKGGVAQKTADEIIKIIGQEEETKNKLAEDIRQAVAIYQGQATLGKIINVVLHEGRHPLNYFKNEIPNLEYWTNSYLEFSDINKLKKILRIAEGIGSNADVFIKLFGRLDPLAAGKRSRIKAVKLKKTIEDTLAIFDNEMKSRNIAFVVECPSDFTFLCWSQDLFHIFTNLIDNSIYWISENKSKERTISIFVSAEGNSLQFIDYRDTGPGIEPTHIASGVIFEPQFSTKPNGTGLGLAIAGEAAARNGLELRAFESESGAYFRLQPEVLGAS